MTVCYAARPLMPLPEMLLAKLEDAPNLRIFPAKNIVTFDGFMVSPAHCF